MKDRLLKIFFLLLFIFLIYINLGFSLIRGEWGSLLFMFIISIFLFSPIVYNHKTKLFILCSIVILNITNFVFILLGSTGKNKSDEKMVVQGKISDVTNNYKYVYFTLENYPKISFKSYNQSVRDSFKIYSDYYNKIPAYLEKKAQTTILKSHFEWVNQPPVSLLIGFPKEIEIDSLKIIE